MAINGKNVMSYVGYMDGYSKFHGNRIEELTEYSKNDFNAKKIKWTDLVIQEDREYCKKIFIEALKSNRAYTRSYRIRTKSGSIKWVEEWGEIVLNDSGGVDFISGVVIDKCHEKDIESEQRKREYLSGKYLIFSMNNQRFGISYRVVEEITNVVPIKKIPQLPKIIRGVVNIRNRVISVLDLHFILGFNRMTMGQCVVIIRTNISTMRRCWKVKECNKTDCPAFQSRDSRCWLISGTHCRNEIRGSFYEKMEECNKCCVFIHAKQYSHSLTCSFSPDNFDQLIYIDGKDITPKIYFGSNISLPYILGFAKIVDDIVILIDTDQLISSYIEENIYQAYK